MTREEAIDMCREVRHYLTSGNPIWDKNKVGEALEMAIEALQKPPITQRSMYQLGYIQGQEDALKREPSEDLISKAEAIEAITTTLDEIDHVPKWVFDTPTSAIDILPSADRSRGEWTLMTEERPVDDYEIMATAYWPGYGDSTIAVGHIDRFDNWHLYSPTEGELIKGFEVIAWMPLPEPYKESDTK